MMSTTVNVSIWMPTFIDSATAVPMHTDPLLVCLSMHACASCTALLVRDFKIKFGSVVSRRRPSPAVSLLREWPGHQHNKVTFHAGAMLSKE